MKRRRPLEAYFVALGVLVVLAGAAAGIFTYVQSTSDARQSATADASYAAQKAAAQIESGLQVIAATNKATVADPAGLVAIFDDPSKCRLGDAPIGAVSTGPVEIVPLKGPVGFSSPGAV